MTKFVQGEWRDIAIGKKLQFERALVIPSKKLNNGEIFIPKYNEGEQVLNFRSPFLNSNGMCISTNKIVEDALAPDGKTLEGIIVVSDETSEHIYKRLSKQIEEILPDAIAKGLQTNGIEEYLNQENYSKLDTPGKIEFTDRFNEYTKILNETGFDIQLLPYESEQERQARDYDGDCIGFERASKYPNLTAEAIERNLPEKAYAPTVKLKKASFYDEQGNQPSFETIAKHMSDGISVGIINNHLTSLEALESEMEVIKEYGDVNLQVEYISGVGKHYENLFKKENPEKVETLIPDKYREYINDVIGYAIEVFNTNSENRQEPLLKAMDANKNLYRELIADAAYQNQIAVDLFKSSTTPDIDSINQNSRLLHRSVNYIKDKKNSKVYDTETIKVTGYSPVELIIAKTNQYFKSSQVESRPLSQFQDFFKGVDYTNQQRMHSLLTKKEFDTAFNAATRFSKRRETEKGPSVELELNNGKKLDVSNLLDANNQKIWDAKSIKVKIIPIDSDKISSSKPHKYAVYAQVDAQVDKNGKPEFSRLGNISKEQEFSFSKEIGVEFNTVIDVKNHQFQPALSEGQAKLLYNQAYEVARNFYDSIPLQEKESMAAAAWAISTTRESIPKDTDESEIGKEINKVKKVSNFVFAAFENEIIERTKQLQLENTKIIKFDKNSPIFKQDAEIRYNVDKEGKDVIEIKNENGEYKTFAELESQASRLPIGTTATATANYNEIYTATVTTQIPGKPPITFDIKELIKYELGQQPFNGEQVELEIQCVNRAQEDYVIYGKDSKGNAIKIGRIDDSSVKQGIEQAWLQEKPGQGQNFQLKLTQIVSGKNAYVIGETPDGNMLRINLDHNFKENNIQDTDYRNVTMKAHGVSNVYMATINGKPLGKIGVIPRSGLIRDKSLLALKDAGIIKNGQITVKIPTTIQSNQTTATVTLNQETIKYPKQWTKRHNILNSKEDRLTFQEDANNKILSQINTRPTILFQDSQQKLSGKIGLAIDENCLENIKFYLDKKGIEYEEMPKKQANLEAKKGMTVLIINESTLSKQVKDILIERAGSVVKNNDVLEQNIPIITEQTVYFIDPNQKAIGFVVPDSNVTDIQKWLDKEGSEFNCLIEENNNTTIILVKEDSVDSLTIDTLNKKLGKPIDVSTIEGFDRYEANSKNLNEADSKQTPFFSIQYNEYQKAIKQLPNRPRKLAEEEIPLSFAPASPLEKDSQTPIQTKTASIPQKVLSTEALIYKDEREISVGIEDQLAKARAALGKEETPSLQQENTQSTQIEWARYAPKGKEGYELSSVGDARFSALNAKLQDGRTIEEAYQLDVKGYRSQGDNWRLGKGKAPLTPMTKEEGYQKYKDLWKQWAQENPRLMDELAQKAQRQVLTDKFASTDVSQARALAEILSERTQALTQKQESQQIVLPSSKEANKNVALEIMGKINESKVLELRQHLEENYKPLMDADKSNYASGRQVAWVNAKWELKEKDFSPGIKDDKLMELVKQVYPDANIALVTYSEREEQGIDYHRDDSYAAAEARSINIGVSMWGYQTAKEKMVAWDANANDNAPIQEFKLESGTVTRFNSKNPHAALETSAGRWSINVWSIKNDLGKDNSVREKFDKFQASNQEPTAVVETNKNLTIKDSEWTPGSEIKVERSYSTLSEANTAGIIRMGNATQERASAPNIPDNPQISGKPIPMNWELNQPPELKDISTTIDAMRGKGRVHSTRAQNYYQTYGIKEGDIAIAKGKDDKQVAFRVGKQYKITQAMIDNPNYQKAWENWEKHSVKELTQNQAAKGKERQIYGLFMEPLGDYQNGKITPFEQHQQQERTLNITFNGASRNNGKPNATASAAAILVNPEERVKEFSQYLGNKTNNEAEFQAAIIGMKAAQDIGYKSIKIQGDSQLVVEALQGKRNVNAENLKPLYQEAKSLLQSFDKIEISYVPREQNKAADSLANKALDDAAQSINPIAHLEPVSQATAKHMVKDNAMAKVATQYIGISAAPKDTPSSTRNYAEAWSDKANTGSYTNEDTIMVSGSGPWRGINQTQIEENFKKEYVPLLDKAITARSDIVVGNAKGTDELVKNYLQEKGYKLEQTTDNYAKLSSQEKEINSHEVQQKTSTEELVINPNASGLGAVLSNATDFAKKSGKLENDYQVSINGNPEAQAGKYGLESHDFKPAGIPYNSAEHAYVHQSQVNPDKDPYKVMVEVLQAKIEQHPRLAKTITKKGGIDYLENAQIINEQDKQWEGKGKESKFVRALAEAYTNIVEKSSQNVETAPSTKAETDKPKITLNLELLLALAAVPNLVHHLPARRLNPNKLVQSTKTIPYPSEIMLRSQKVAMVPKPTQTINPQVNHS
ncbi:MAG: ribonuclease HI family protein [Richelia sp. RM1_1_1]|nr:ribonuclease HI family protein [Richelia sp. RM1_1_1]